MDGPGSTTTSAPRDFKQHITIAGRQDTLFSADAVELIHRAGRGLPRPVNNIAWQSLIAAFAQDEAIVDESSTRLAITGIHTTEYQDQAVSVGP